MTQYLILHRVRGEPAFDIAEKIVDMSRDEDWWIVPTSGHRAYPYKSWPLHTLVNIIDFGGELPDDWPDHYSCNNQQDGGGDKPRSVPAARKSTVTPLTIDDLE